MLYILLCILIVAVYSFVASIVRGLRATAEPDPPQARKAAGEAFASMLGSIVLPLFLPAGLYWITDLAPHDDGRLAGGFVLLFGPPLLIGSLILWALGASSVVRFRRCRAEGPVPYKVAASLFLGAAWVLIAIWFFPLGFHLVFG